MNRRSKSRGPLPLRLVTALVRHRIAAAAAAGITTLLLLLPAAKNHVDNSLEVWFVDNDPALISYRDFLDTFGNDEVVVTAIQGETAEVTGARILRLTRLTDSLEAIEGVARVASLANAIVLEPRGMYASVREIVDSPVDSADVTRAVAALDRGGIATMFTGRKTDTFLLFTWMDTGADIEEQRGRIISEIRAATNASLGAGEHASHGGLGVVYDALNEITISDGTIFILLSYVVMFLVLYVITRRIAWTGLALLAVTCADISLLGVMGLMNRPINMITMAIPALVMVLGVANIVHMGTDIDLSLRAGRTSRRDLLASLSVVAVPCLFNALTTAVAFLSLTTASMGVTRDYGLFAAVGVLFAFVYALIAMSVVLPRATRFGPAATHAWMGRIVERVALASMRHRRAVVGAAIALTVVATIGAARIVVDTYSIDFLPSDHPVRAESDFIEESARPYVPLELTLTAPSAESWKRPEFLERVAAAQAALESDPRIGRTFSIGDVFHDMHVSLTGEALDRPWAPEIEGEPQQFLRYIRMAQKEDDLSRLIASDDRTLRLTATTPMASARVFTAVSERALATVRAELGDAADVAVTGYLPLYGAMISHILDDQVRSFALAFLLVFLVISIVLRSRRFTLAAIPPNLVPVAVVLGVMGYAGIRLDIATVTIAAVVLGIIVDDTVHILYRLKRELRGGATVEVAMSRVARASGVAVVSSSVVFCAGFLVVGLAGAKSISSVGLLTATAVAAALLTDVILLPAFAGYLFGERAPREESIPESVRGELVTK